MNRFINVADIQCSDDPEGRTYREINNAKEHSIPVGALVEIGDEEYPSKSDGVQLFVVCLSRDCDGTPLYYLAADPDDKKEKQPGFKNTGWRGGYDETSLTLIEKGG